MTRQQKIDIGFAVLAVVALFAFQVWMGTRSVAELSYSDLMTQVQQGHVAEVTVTETSMVGRFTTPQDGKEHFVTTRVDPALAEALAQHGVVVNGGSDSNWLTTILSWIIPAAVMVGIWIFAIRRLGGGAIGGLTTIGKSKAKVYVETATGVTFKDVAGIDEAEAELEEIVSFLKDKSRYGRLGARIPKGILLVGPPGTGKTLLARAIAGEAGVPFFSISGSEFVEMFVGVGAARVRDLFEQARQAAPCIIFIDELDSLGRARGPLGGFGGNDEKEQTLNQLLAEMDGFDPRVGIVLLAATNRPEVLDPALLRAGRFDRQVSIERPDKAGREAILKVHVKMVRLAPNVALSEVAGLTPGFTGADLANLVNEAAICATRRGADVIETEDFVAAVERIVAGLERRSRVLTPDERKRVAYHESGHALVAAALPGTDPVQKVSIIPRSVGALGYTMQRPTEDRFLITVKDLKNRLTVLVAGRAAEELAFGDISTGAADDFAKATDVARQMVCRFGMSPELGQAVLESQQQAYLSEGTFSPAKKDYSEQTAREIDLAVKGMLDAAYDEAKSLLEARSKDLEACAEMLLEKESITPADFPPLAAKARLPRAAE